MTNGTFRTIYLGYFTNITDSSSVGNLNNFINYFVTDEYAFANTQLTLTSENQLYPNVSSYGKKGILTGNNTIWNNIPTSTFLSTWFGLAYSNPSQTVANNVYATVPCQTFVTNTKVLPDTDTWDGSKSVTFKTVETTTDTKVLDFPYKEDFANADKTFYDKTVWYNNVRYRIIIKGTATVASGWYTSINSVISVCINLNNGSIVAYGKYNTPFAPVDCQISGSQYNNYGYPGCGGFDFDTNTFYVLFVAWSSVGASNQPKGCYGLFSLNDTNGSIIRNSANIGNASSSYPYGRFESGCVRFDYKNKEFVCDTTIVKGSDRQVRTTYGYKNK